MKSFSPLKSMIMQSLVSLNKSLTSASPRTKLWRHTLVQSFCLSWFIALTAQVKAPFYPIPMNLNDWTIMLIALLAARRVAVGAVLLYLSYATMGLPVLASEATGLSMFLGPTAGYLVGYILMSATIAARQAHYPTGKFWVQLGVVLVGNIVFFTAGLSWLAYLMGWQMALQVGLLPFVWIQSMKVALAAALSVYIRDRYLRP